MTENTRLNPFDRWHLARRRLASSNLKCCPLCSALNAEENHECFVCGWRGLFERDPDTVEAGLNRLMRQCPELNEPATPQTRRRNIRAIWHRLMGRGVDFQA
jgi:hypothetical protein